VTVMSERKTGAENSMRQMNADLRQRTLNQRVGGSSPSWRTVRSELRVYPFSRDRHRRSFPVHSQREGEGGGHCAIPAGAWR